jgi:hypothetical protein
MSRKIHMHKNASWCLKILVLGYVSIIGLSACESNTEKLPEATSLPVWVFQNEKTFNTVYPEGWSEEVVKEGFLVFSPPEVGYEGNPGPSLTVLRQVPERIAFSLEEEFNHFLEFGPLREDYTISSPNTPFQVGEYEGIRVGVERQASDIYISMKGVIVAVKTKSATLYYFIATAPTEQWEESWPLLLAIIQNVTFNE